MAKSGLEVEIVRPALGANVPRSEHVFVLAATEADALALVRTALRLTDEALRIVRELSEREARSLGLKPFQVRHAPQKLPPVEETIRNIRARAARS